MVKPTEILELAKAIADKWPALALVAALASGVLRLGPGAWVDSLGLKETVAQQRPVFGMVFLASCALVVLAVLRVVGGRLNQMRVGRCRARDLRLSLDTLSDGEKQLLHGAWSRGNARSTPSSSLPRLSPCARRGC